MFATGAVLCGTLVYGVLSYKHATGPFRGDRGQIEGRDPAWAKPWASQHLRNLYRVSDQLYRGAQPDHDGFLELQRMGIKTVINLRLSSSDRKLLAGTSLISIEIPAEPWNLEASDVLAFLRVVTDPAFLPVFVHCSHGADRTGAMTAVYRVVVQGWDKEEAIREMTHGGFGYHTLWKNLPTTIQKLDVQGLAARLAVQKGKMAAPTAADLGPDGEEIVFQVDHANFAWHWTSEGFFINARGEVKRFDSFDAPNQTRYPLYLPPKPRHADLLRSFGAHPRSVSVVPPEELALQQALARAARDAPLVCGPAAKDMGGVGFYAWVMNGEGVYSRIRLGEEGDIACRSLSPAAGEVKTWLESITGMGGYPQLPARACKTQPCTGGTDCFSETYCESVADCGWCANGHVCVEGPDGKKHCSYGDRPDCKAPTCSCYGHAICPGGDDDCRQTTGGALTCQR